jgi:hypothetical protein
MVCDGGANVWVGELTNTPSAYYTTQTIMAAVSCFSTIPIPV